MADMDLDDLDGPSQVPSRTTRFAPKNSKLKPQTKLKLKSEPLSSPDQHPQDFDSIPPKKKEELDSHPPPPFDSTTAKTEYADGAVKMDFEAKPECGEVKDDPMEEDDDGRDRVVREIDVFFTPQIDSNTQLYVMQYPLRPCWRPYELDDRCEEVRVKPTSTEVEVDLSIDVDSKNYDTDADPRVRMTKQTLSSSMRPTCATGYAVGVLMGNKLHINPIRAVVQLRPSMEHLKSGGSKKKNSGTSNADVTIKSEDLKDDKSAGPSKKQNKLPATSNEHNNDLGEGWVALKYHSSKSDFSVRYLEKMAVDEGSPIHFSMSPYDYVSSLCPGAFNGNIKPKGPPKRFLLSLPLEERFKTWLREGPPANRFDTIKHLAPTDSIEDVLGVLQKLAHLVQGLWVPKTALFEGNHGVEGLARDYILLLFSKNPAISYEQINVARSLGKAIKGVLNVLAIERPSLKDWKLKELPDTSFMKLHPNIVKEQEQAWGRVEKSITESIFGSRKGPIGLKNSAKPDMANRPGTSKNPSKVMARSSNGAVSRTPMSIETREALPKALQKLFQTHKVCSFQQICQRLREMALSESTRPKGVPKDAIAAAKGFDTPQEELLEIIGQVATNIHGVYVSKSSSDHPQYDPLRKVVIDLLIAEGPNAKLKKASIVEAAKMQLNRDITPNEYQKVLNELCISQGSAWVLKRGDGNPK
ncbi:DNA-directed RNA polymerase III subunit RPC5 [Camellia lanceoleosa]|uniref:DNA-directed RNA polymerase III subunit RPC5 n=1 Tax=Camellia lanceoleosa TaxID=1840588 RepID=A0ACC0J3Q2_9ERIC|nr:DNA-directed RNA polymerase III subunit RPC5 [Camellia lanceoleosa]